MPPTASRGWQRNKAMAVFEEGRYGETIEVIIAADTEVVEGAEDRIVRNPTDADQCGEVFVRFGPGGEGAHWGGCSRR